MADMTRGLYHCWIRTTDVRIVKESIVGYEHRWVLLMFSQTTQVQESDLFSFANLKAHLNFPMRFCKIIIDCVSVGFNVQQNFRSGFYGSRFSRTHGALSSGQASNGFVHRSITV